MAFFKKFGNRNLSVNICRHFFWPDIDVLQKTGKALRHRTCINNDGNPVVMAKREVISDTSLLPFRNGQVSLHKVKEAISGNRCFFAR